MQLVANPEEYRMGRPGQETVDVVVVGAGNAGFCAAHAARETGASVLVLEKGERGADGGNSFYTAGAFRVVHQGLDEHLREVVDDETTLRRWDETDLAPYPVADFPADLERVTDGRNDSRMTEVVTADSAGLVRWLAGHGIRWRLMYERQSYVSGG